MQIMNMPTNAASVVDLYVATVMTVPLRASGVDLTDPDAVTAVLADAHFGDRLIERCGPRAAIEAMKPSPAWAPHSMIARTPQEQEFFDYFGEVLIDAGVDLEDKDAVTAVIRQAGFRSENVDSIAVGAAQAAMRAVHA